MKQGTITGISGPVIDVHFPEGSLPAIIEALTVEANGTRYTMEYNPIEAEEAQAAAIGAADEEEGA